jgi:hypothetical protein
MARLPENRIFDPCYTISCEKYSYLQAEGRYSDSQEMAGAVGAAARVAIEAGERDSGLSACA